MSVELTSANAPDMDTTKRNNNITPTFLIVCNRTLTL